MSSKTRKLIWSVPIMATFAIVGALAVFVVLGLPNANPAYAQDFNTDPTAPTGIALTAGNGEVTVVITQPTNPGVPEFTGYSLQYNEEANSVTVSPDDNDPGWTDAGVVAVRRNGDGAAVVTGLTNGARYFFRAAVTLGDDTGPYLRINADTAVPIAVVPGAPENVSASQTGADEVTVSWEVPDNQGGTPLGVTSYVVTYTIGGTAGTETPVIDGLGATITDGLIVPDAIVVVSVAAKNSIGLGTAATADAITIGFPDHEYTISSSSSSASSNVELVVEISDIPQRLVVGSSIELYLEDDFVVPASIPAGTAYFIVTGGATPPPSGTESADDKIAREEANSRLELSTGSAAPVLTTSPGIVDSDDHFAGDDDHAIQVVIPDLCAGSTEAGAGACDGQNGPQAGQTVMLVIGKTAGIRNPTEEKKYSVGAQVLPLGTSAQPNSGPDAASLAKLEVLAKITLSDDDNTRGYELTITGAGFNNGTTADAYVLQAATAPEDCEALVANPNSTLVGSGLVGSDDIVAIVVEVTVPTFGAGKVNHICMVDGENRHSSETLVAKDFDTFFLEPSIRAVPSTVSSGDTVNIFAQDFAIGGETLTSLKLAGLEAIDEVRALVRGTLINGAATSSFEVPGSVGGEPLQGTVRLDARFGNLTGTVCNAAGNCTTEDTKITVTGSELTASATNVLPNETLTITGNGYGSQTLIDAGDITLDNVPVEVDIDSTIPCVRLQQPIRCVEVSNSGQFVATITLWPDARNNVDNPTLISGSHTLNVEDSQGFVGSTTLTIAEPTISVTPEVVGPRDYIVITGTNWPVDNADNSNAGLVVVRIDDDDRGREYSVYTDATGRFTVEHRVSKVVAIPSTVQITGTYSDVVKVGSFAIPAATITVDPADAQPGDLVSLSATDLKPYTSADEVKIGGSEINFDPANTDIDGNITLTDLLVPGLDPGTYSVVLKVDETVAIGEINVLAEDSARGAGAELPDALMDLGDSLVRVFHFNGVDKSWDFYDPRADFADLNTLTTMVNGEPYWILVSEGQEDVVLNNRARTLTCVGGDCWNQIVW